MRAGASWRFRPGRLLLWSAPLVWLGCGGTDVVLPSLSVTTSTSGVELDPDGYSLVVDASPAQPIGLDATVTIERLSEGAHNVALTGLAANCTAGNNPRSVTVQSGATTQVDFAVACSATGGNIAVSVTTSGLGSDPDGFALLLDGTDRGPIAVNASTTLTGLTPGVHLLALSGVAVNCQVAGDNSRAVTVTAGQTAPVSFAVSCSQPPPNSGNALVTTATSGTPLDPDGYGLTVDQASEQAIAANASVNLAGLSAGVHRIGLTGVALTCAVAGQNPRSVSITAGQTTPVAFNVSCSATTGALNISVSGLPAGAAAAITVAGPGGFSRSVAGSGALTGLASGSYTVTAATVTVGGTSYAASVDRPNVTVTAGATSNVAVSYSAASGSGLNLRIDGFYLTQSVQTRTGGITLVHDRKALLRVFVLASQSNTARPEVRARFFRSGAVIRTIMIPASRSSTPTTVNEGVLGSSWNTEVDASLVRPEVSLAVDVDPSNAVAESNENDNALPASGAPRSLLVQPVAPAAIRFVPVLQTANGLRGTVSNATNLVDLARRIYPLNQVQTDVHDVYTTTGPLQPGNENNQWNQILTEIEALRVAENSSQTYYGVVKLGYGQGIVGVGFVGDLSAGSPRSALGWDDPGDARRVLAHELGHTWGQLHAPCGSPLPANIDPGFPYPAGNIGVYGYDATAGTLEPPASSDIMGYCPNPWISDYTYRRVQTFRRTQPAGATAGGTVQPCLLLWGRITGGGPVLEPAFQIVTRPRLPQAPGPYTLEATAADGRSIFRLSFDATPVADDPRGSRQFVFAVPLDPSRAALVGRLRLTGPGAQMAAMSQSTARLGRAGRPDSVVARRDVAGVTLSWDPAVHPMIMVRDAETGQVLSFARGGSSRVWTAKGAVDLELSDGVKSQRLRLAINRQ